MNAVTCNPLPIYGDLANNMALKSSAYLAVAMGLAGTDWVTDTAVHNGNWWVFHAVTDCVLAGVTYISPSSGSPANITLKAGDRIYGRITSLQLASGSGELYRAAI